LPRDRARTRRGPPRASGCRGPPSEQGDERVGRPFEYEQRLTALTRRLEEVDIQLTPVDEQTATYPTGTSTAYGYDNMDRLNHARTTQGSPILSDYGYAPDLNGNRTRQSVYGAWSPVYGLQRRR